MNVGLIKQKWPLTALLFVAVLMDYVCVLPAPSQVSMKSINMRHTLSWLPLQDECNTTALYSVQYQGEFERLVLNGSWLDAAQCQLILLSECDVSSDLGSDSDYVLRIRVHCGAVLSPWKQLAPPFNRRDTVLTEPELKMDVGEGGLLMSFQNVPLICSVRVSMWKSGHEDQVVLKVVRSEQFLWEVPSLQEGEKYCVQAQTELPSGQKSRHTDPHCVLFPGPGESWKKATTVAFVVLISVGFLCAVFWSIVHCQTQTSHKFFHKEPLPRSLKEYDAQIPMQIPEEQLESLYRLQIVLPNT